MTRTPLTAASCALFLVLCLPARQAAAQVPPFFNGGATIFDPEISVVQSGILEDVTATVSADRKYVTLTTRYQQANLLSLQEFAFQVGNAGVPAQPAGGGGAAPGGAAGGAAGGARAGNAAAGATSAAKHPVSARPYPKPGSIPSATTVSVLDQPGMTLVGRARPAPSPDREIPRP